MIWLLLVWLQQGMAVPHSGRDGHRGIAWIWPSAEMLIQEAGCWRGDALGWSWAGRTYRSVGSCPMCQVRVKPLQVTWCSVLAAPRMIPTFPVRMPTCLCASSRLCWSGSPLASSGFLPHGRSCPFANPKPRNPL